MYIRRLDLTNFRNYRQLELSLAPGEIVVQGGNAQGKTNLLEAIYYLATATTPHALSDRELIHWQALAEPAVLLHYGRLEGDFVTDGEERRVEITLTLTPQTGTEGERFDKTIKVGGVRKRVADLTGLVNVVLFTPTDTQLVAGPPGARRRFLDALLGQLDPRYARSLTRYSRVVSQRNHLLRRLRDAGGGAGELDFWNDQLVEYGAAIVAYRIRAVERLNARMRRIHASLTGGVESLTLRYASSVLKYTQPAEAQLSRSEIEDTYRERLAQRERAERARGMTLVGPHRADITLLVDGVDMGLYSSRGQQRTISLGLRLAQAELIQAVSGAPPILLLDDVMSELDAARRQYLMDVAAQHQQAFLTSTDLSDFADDFLHRARVLRVEGGRVEDVPPVASSE
jgi:DNA replication and repair protein RecF